MAKKLLGYKNHVKALPETKLVATYEVTPTNIYDRHVVENLMEKRDCGQALYGDSAYRSKSVSGG
jgi:hypothetical protein